MAVDLVVSSPVLLISRREHGTAQLITLYHPHCGTNCPDDVVSPPVPQTATVRRIAEKA